MGFCSNMVAQLVRETTRSYGDDVKADSHLKSNLMATCNKLDDLIDDLDVFDIEIGMNNDDIYINVITDSGYLEIENLMLLANISRYLKQIKFKQMSPDNIEVDFLLPGVWCTKQ